MLRSIIFLTFLGSSVQQIPDTAQDLLYKYLSRTELFDGPTTFVTSPRNTSNKRLSLEDLMYYNYFAGAVYCSDQLANLTCKNCKQFRDDVSFSTVLTNDTTSSAALIVTQPVNKQIVVSFRGSSSIPDFVLDFTLLNINIGDNIRIHRGFLIATASLYPRVVAALQQELGLHPEFKVVITGHSLGGAMATVTQFFFKYNNQFPNVDFVLVTYGQPRVGNFEYANFMNSLDIPMVRVVNKGDIMPHLATVVSIKGTDLFDKYLHHQTEYWVQNDNGTYCSDVVYEDPTCSNSVGPAYSVVHHTYTFDENYAVCIGSVAYSFLSIPWVFNPDYLPGVLPIIPEFISPAIAGVITSLIPLTSLI